MVTGTKDLFQQRLKSFGKRLDFLAGVKSGRLYSAEEAKADFGIDLDPAWSVKVEPYESESGYAFTYQTPEGWQIKPDQTRISPEGWTFKDIKFGTTGDIEDYLAISPEGAKFTRAQLEAPPMAVAPTVEAEPPVGMQPQVAAGAEETVLESEDYAFDPETEQYTPVRDLRLELAQDTTSFIADLYSKTSVPKAEQTLRLLNIPDDVIIGISQQVEAAGLLEEKRTQVIQTIFPQFSVEDLANLIDENPVLFWDTIQTGNSRESKVELLRMLGMSDAEIAGALRFQKLQIPVDGQTMRLSVDRQNQVAYDERGDFVGRWNPATQEFTKAPQENIAKDIFDWVIWGAKGYWENIENFALTVLPELISKYMIMTPLLSEYEKRLGIPPVVSEYEKQVEEVARTELRRLYAENKTEYEEWMLKHPEMKPSADYQEGAFKHPELLKDPRYYAYELANITPFLVTAAGMAALTGGVGLGAMLGTALIMTPIEGQQVYEDLIAAGAPEDKAAELALAAGTLIGGLESVGRIPLLKQISPLLMRRFKGEATKALVKRGVAETIKRFGRNFTIDQFSEVSTEVLQEIVGNTAVSFFNENRDILANVPDIAVKTAVATIVPGGFAAGVSVRQVAPSITQGLSEAQMKARGWVQDIQTQKWYQKVSAETGAIELPGGEAISKAAWEGMLVEQRVELAKSAGLEGKVGSKAFEALTKDEAAKLSQQVIKPPAIEMAPSTSVQTGLPGMGKEAAQAEMLAEVSGKEAGKVPLADVEKLKQQEAAKAEAERLKALGQTRLEEAQRKAEEAPEEDKVAYEAQAELEVLKDTLANDPVAQARFKIGGKSVGLDHFISLRERTYPDYFTVKQAEALFPGHDFSAYTQKGTSQYNHVPRDVALDDLTKATGMTPDQIAGRVNALRKERARIKELEATVTREMTKMPLEPRPEVTDVEIRQNWETMVSAGTDLSGVKGFTIEQIDALNSVFAEYINSPSVLSAWELTRELRREARGQRAQILKARAQELMVSQGLNTEDSLKQAIMESMSGELPRATTEYLANFAEDMRDALFAKVYHVLKEEPYEMMSTITALTNALQGRPIPREPGVRGGSAYSRLQRVFGEQQPVLKALDKMATEKKPLDNVMEGMFREIMEGGNPPIPIDQEKLDYLRKLSNIPNGYKTLLEPPFDNPRVTDLRTPQDLAFAKAELELGTKLAEGKITLEEHQLELMKARDAIWPPVPPIPFDPAIGDAFKELPFKNMNYGEKLTIVRLLKELGMIAVDIGSFIRANKASFDMSFWRQQKTLIAGHPVAFYRANVEAFKAMFSQKSAEASWQWITHDPLYHIYDQINVDFLRPLEVEKGTARWKGVEEYGYLTGERLIPKIASKIPWVKWSARAFVSGTNAHNWMVFKTLYKATLRRAEKIASGQIKLAEGEAFDIAQEMTDYAKMLSDFTQRAQLGKAAPLAPALGALFFAPRSKLGRMLTPRHLVSSNPRVRAEAWKDLTLMVTAFGGLVMTGAVLGLWDVETDPRNAEFMSIRIGKMRLDPWAGYRQFVVLYARLISGTGISSVTGAEYEVNPVAALNTFFRSSLAPMSSIILDFWTGRNFLGEKLDIADKRQWVERIAPFSIQDMWDAFDQSWQLGAISVLPAIFGEGVQTYTGDWEDSWAKLGLRKYFELPEPRHTTQDVYADHSAEFTGVDPESLTERKGYPPYIKMLAEVKLIKEGLDLLPNEKLVKIKDRLAEGKTIDDLRKLWQERQKLVDAGDDAEYTISELQPDGKYKEVTYKSDKALSAFDSKKITWVKDATTQGSAASLGNFTQKQYALLMEYGAIEDKDKQAEFLKQHEAEIGVNPRQEYLRSHALENAKLSLFGQTAPSSEQPAKFYTKEAYNEFKKLVEQFGIPDAGLPEKSLPPEGSIDNYFGRLKAVDKYGANSAEAMLILAKDEELRKFLKLDKPEQPFRYYELQAKNRNERLYWQDLGDKDSKNYIKNDDERREAFLKKFPNTEYFDDMRRVDAIANKFSDDMIEDWVERGRLVDKYSPGSPKVKEWAFENPEAYRKALEENILTDKGALGDEERGHYEAWVEPAIRLQAKNIVEDKYWSELSDKTSGKYVKDEKERREAFFKRFPNSEYFDDVERIEAYKAGFIKSEADLWSERGRVLVKYEPQSAEAKLWLIDHPDLFKKALEAKLLTDDGKDWNVPALRLTVKWRNEEAAYDGIVKRYNDMSDAKVNTLPVPEGMNENAWALKTAKQKRDWLSAKERADYLKGNAEYRQGKNSITAYELGLTDAKDTSAISDLDRWLAYQELPEQGFWRERYLVDNPGWFQKVTDLQKAKGQDPWDKPEKVPDIEYDNIYDQLKEQFQKWDSYNDPESPDFIEDTKQRDKARDALIFKADGKYTVFGIARIEREGHYKLVPKKYITNYVDYYRLVGEGKPDDYPEGLAYWEDNWFMIENPEFHTEVWTKLLGNEPYPVRVETRKASQVVVDKDGKVTQTPPTREIGAKYIEFKRLKTQEARDLYRLNNADLDNWGVAAGIWELTMSEKRAAWRETPSEKFKGKLDEGLKDFKKYLEGLS